MVWIPRSEDNDRYCDWLIAKGYDPADQEEDDICYQEYKKEKQQVKQGG